MRRIAVILFIALSAISAASQNKSFIAVSKSGDCSIINGGNWAPLQVGTVLTPESVLRNSGQPEAELQLIGTETHDSYKLFILHSQFEMSVLFNAPQAEYRKGTASSYFRYVLQNALEANADTHFIRNYTGMTHRGDSLAMNLDTEKIINTLSGGATFSFATLRNVDSDYPVSSTVVTGGVILDNEADISLDFVLYCVQDSPEGSVLTAVFGDDDVINVPARTKRFKKADIPADAGLLLIAYEKPLDPITLKRALYLAEGAVPTRREIVKVGVFSTF